jgi:hypothetical protein
MVDMISVNVVREDQHRVIRVQITLGPWFWSKKLFCREDMESEHE